MPHDPAADSDLVAIYTTTATPEDADRLARSLLDAKLIACANRFAAGVSHYVWENEIRSEPESVLICKTTEAKAADAIAAIERLHPYDVPCATVFRIESGSAAYLDWVRGSVAD